MNELRTYTNSDKKELTQAEAAVLLCTLTFAHGLGGGPTEERCEQLVKGILSHTSRDNSTIDDFNNLVKECLAI